MSQKLFCDPVAVFQKNSRRLWQSQRRKSTSVPEGGADFQQPFSLPENAQTLAGIAFRAAGKSVRNFRAALKFARKRFQQGISDSHSLLEFSEFLLDFRAYEHGLTGPQKPKTDCDNSSCANLSFTTILTLRSGPVWRQDLAILSPEGPRDSTCQLRC